MSAAPHQQPHTKLRPRSKESRLLRADVLWIASFTPQRECARPPKGHFDGTPAMQSRQSNRSDAVARIYRVSAWCAVAHSLAPRAQCRWKIVYSPHREWWSGPSDDAAGMPPMLCMTCNLHTFFQPACSRRAFMWWPRQKNGHIGDRDTHKRWWCYYIPRSVWLRVYKLCGAHIRLSVYLSLIATNRYFHKFVFIGERFINM